MDWLYVRESDLRSHASHVRGLQSQVAKAQSAAAQANFSAEMFGKIGSKLVWPLMKPLEVAGTTSMNAIDEIYEHTASTMDKVATEFETVDGAIHDGFKLIEELLT